MASGGQQTSIRREADGPGIHYTNQHKTCSQHTDRLHILEKHILSGLLIFHNHFSQKNSQKTPHTLTMRARYEVSSLSSEFAWVLLLLLMCWVQFCYCTVIYQLFMVLALNFFVFPIFEKHRTSWYLKLEPPQRKLNTRFKIYTFILAVKR